MATQYRIESSPASFSLHTLASGTSEKDDSKGFVLYKPALVTATGHVYGHGSTFNAGQSTALLVDQTGHKWINQVAQGRHTGCGFLGLGACQGDADIKFSQVLPAGHYVASIASAGDYSEASLTVNYEHQTQVPIEQASGVMGKQAGLFSVFDFSKGNETLPLILGGGAVVVGALFLLGGHKH